MAKTKSVQKIKTILISQPDPGEDSPYKDIIKKHGLKVEFRKLIDIEGVSLDVFRKQGLNPLEFDGVIFTSKQAVDHFFRLVKELKTEMPPDTKYFCVGEATAKYLQKYIVIRKRKLFVGEKTAKDLIRYLKKFSTEKFLYPCSGIHSPELPEMLLALNVKFEKAIMYNTVAADLSDLNMEKYDLVCFFSPSGVDSILGHCPTFAKLGIRVGVFGPTTSKAALEAGLQVDIQAPSPNQPSMAGAIEEFIKGMN